MVLHGGLSVADLARAALSRAPLLDVPTLTAAFDLLGGLSGFIAASDALRLRAGISMAACEFLRGPSSSPTAAELRWIEGSRHHLVPFTDERYPLSLRELPRGPIALYVEGRADVLNDPQLSIVGSRNPSPTGRDIAFEFAESLAAYGLSITSGLAEGIDSAAHKGALSVGGDTVAVLGCGVDVVYPTENRKLMAELAANALGVESASKRFRYSSRRSSESQTTWKKLLPSTRPLASL